MADIALLTEHVAREFDVSCAVAAWLKRKYGLRTAIQPMRFPNLRAIRQAKVVGLPFAQLGEPRLQQVVEANPNACYINLNYEQLLSKMTSAYKAPRFKGDREQMYHLAWGEFFADFLRSHGVDDSRIFITGNPGYALYLSPYRQFYPAKKELAAKFRLDPQKKWLFFPENYGAAFYSERTVQDIAARGGNPAQVRELMGIMEQSLKIAATAWANLLAAQPDVELIVRPRPATSQEIFRRKCLDAWPPLADVPVHVTKELSAREWILASDIVVSSYSTTLLEAAVAGKQVHMFEPIAFPEWQHVEWHDHVGRIRDSRGLIEACRIPRDPEPPALARWATEKMLPCGDPIERLAETLAGIHQNKFPRLAPRLELPEKDKLEIPSPAANSKARLRRTLAWGLGGIFSRWRINPEMEYYHQRTVRRMTDRWSKICF